jgi:hypothetical protein
MSTYFGINSNSVNTLFSSLGSSSESGLTNIISDYYSLRNGSYKKLLNAYYSLDSTDKKATSSTSTSKDSTKLLSTIESSTDDLKNSTDALLKTETKSVFAKNTSGEYDTEGIYTAVSKFVSNYNSVIEDTEDSNTANIASNSKNMITSTKSNASLLSSIGITAKSNGTLSIDEAAFKKADMSVVKSLFNGAGSYGYQMSAKASMINYYAQAEAGKANTYTNLGSYSYNYSAGDILNKLS